MSKTVSRVLYLAVIYLDELLPARSSHPGSDRVSLYAPIPVLLRIEFTASRCSHAMGELLPRLSTLTMQSMAVYLCCTFPKVAFGGCYPLSLPCGARTFLMNDLSICSRDCLFYSIFYFTGWAKNCQRLSDGKSSKVSPAASCARRSGHRRCPPGSR